jgi:hypothetical protein
MSIFCEKYGRVLLIGSYMYVFALFAFMLFGTQGPFAPDDGLRHIVMANTYRMNGFMSDSGWGRYFFWGYFTEHMLNLWWLSEIIYIPFTFFVDQIVGLKVATLVFCALLIAVMSIPLYIYRVPAIFACAYLLTVFLLTPTFSLRLLLGRPFVLLSVIFVGVYLLIFHGPKHLKWFFVSVLLALSTLMSHLFVFPLLLCFTASAVLWWYEKRQEALLCAASAVFGVIMGLILHPHSVEYIGYMLDVFLRTPFTDTGVGNENNMGLFGGDPSSWGGLIFPMLLLVYIHARKNLLSLLAKREDICCSFVLLAGLTVAYFMWVRTVDFYWPVLAMLSLQMLTLTPKMPREVYHAATQIWKKTFKIHWLLIAACVLLAHSGRLAYDTFMYRNHSLLDGYSAIWEVEEGSRVLNIQWHILPPLLFLNDRVTYARGFYPGFDYAYDPYAYDLFEGYADLFEWDFIDMRGTIADAWDRLNLTEMTFVTIRFREDFDVKRWIDDLREHFDADYMVLTKDFDARLVHETKEHLSLFAESNDIAVFAFK